MMPRIAPTFAHICRRCYGTPTVDAIAGKVAVVTGGTSGIGAAAARRLGARQCHVVVAGRSAEKGGLVVNDIQRLGGEATFIHTDVAEEESVRALMEASVSMYGSIDFLFNNAGVEASGFPAKDFHMYVREDTKTIQTNLLGAYWTFSYALPHLTRRGGAVVNTSSNASANGRIGANVSAYAATKAALDALTRHWSVLYRKQDLRVYAVNPFFVATPMVGERVEELSKFLNPSRKVCPPDDVATVVLALLDGTTSYASGDCVLVDAGPTTANIQVMYNLTTELDMKNLQHYLATVIKPAMRPVL